MIAENGYFKQPIYRSTCIYHLYAINIQLRGLDWVFKKSLKQKWNLVNSSLWEPRQKNKVFPLKQTPSQTCSGDTRGVQKALILDLHYIKIDSFPVKQPKSLYNSLYINDEKQLSETV